MREPRSWFQTRAVSAEAAGGDEPIRFDLFNIEQLEAHARSLAVSQQIGARRGPERLLARLRDNAARLREATDQLGLAQQAGQRLTPAGEWLLDNAHLIEEQIRLARQHLPRGYSRQLPQLANTELAGAPRVYAMAIEVIAHVDGRIDRENITRFAAAYQEVSPLALGELWAIPIMLRLALLENLRRVAVRVLLSMEHRQQARGWAALIQGAAEVDPKALLLAVADMARANPPLSNSFVAELVQRLTERGGLVDIPMAWINHQLSEQGASLQQKVQHEAWQQAANQVSVSSSIGSLRFLSAMPWRDFVEDVSLVERALREDPSGVYGAMDFATRDAYRHVVEDLARPAGLSEPAVATLAVELARASDPSGPDPARLAHVGYYLIGEGRPQLRALLTLPPWWRVVGALGPWAWGWLYFSTVLAVTGLATALVMSELAGLGPTRPLVGLLTALCASQLGVALANWIATTFRPPAVLPRLDLSTRITAAHRTLVVVPTLLGSPEGVERLVEGLEVRYLGNRDPDLLFALLTDLTDADAETTPPDEALLTIAREGVERLNARYRLEGAGPFYLFPGRAPTTPASAPGWATSASAASWRPSTTCCAAPTGGPARPSRRSRRWWAIGRRCRRWPTSSPWTPTPSSPGTPRPAWSAPWPTP